MKKYIAILMAMMIVPSVFAAVQLVIPIGITIVNSCPSIIGLPEYDVEVFTSQELIVDALNSGWAGRSYAFDGEAVTFEFEVEDTDGVSQSCLAASMVLDNQLGHQFEVQCSMVSHTDTTAQYECTYIVGPAQEVSDKYWLSAKVVDQCGQGCIDESQAIVSLYLNPEVSLTINTQNNAEFAFKYDSSGNDISDFINAGDTVYTPSFTIENTADPATGVYLVMEMYGTNIYDSGSSGALCPTSNVLSILNVEYAANKLNAQQPWSTMYEGEPNKGFIFDDYPANFIGIGDDVTMRMRINIPSPCYGDFSNGGNIVFVGQVI